MNLNVTDAMLLFLRIFLAILLNKHVFWRITTVKRSSLTVTDYLFLFLSLSSDVLPTHRFHTTPFHWKSKDRCDLLLLLSRLFFPPFPTSLSIKLLLLGLFFFKTKISTNFDKVQFLLANKLLKLLWNCSETALKCLSCSI